MKAKSLSVFRTKLRQSDTGTVLVSVGDIIEGDDEHLRSLARSRLVELLEDSAEVKPAKAKAKAVAKQGKKTKPSKPKEGNE